MKKLLAIILCFQVLILSAKEGMWIPIFLKGALMDEMQLNGLKLSAEDIYDINQSSLKDAVVLFGGGCTAELISGEGLLLTNHHCGYGRIQSHSSLENDYLKNGFWAANKGEELTNPGLTATIIDRMKDATKDVMNGVTDGMSSEEREALIKKNIDAMIKKYEAEYNMKAFVRSFYFGNQYLLFLAREFKDVRLVGAPPSSIGKYGHDTDNWVWPRHTGDFSLFRIYANAENEPAEINESNVPYKPKYHLPISLDGYEKGDFTMVYGFPARTSEYLTASAVDHIINVSNPIKTDIRTRKLKVLDEQMRRSDAVRIKYAAKQSSTSNAWKKWKGQNKGLKRNKALEKKKAFEEKFQFKVALYPDSFGEYANVLNNLNEAYTELNQVSLARDYYVEIGYFGTDLLQLGYRLIPYYEKAEKGEMQDVDFEKMSKLIAAHFKNYDLNTDLKVFKALMPVYLNIEDNFYKPGVLKEIQDKQGKDLHGWMDETYRESILSNEDELNELLEGGNKAVSKLIKDPAFQLSRDLYLFYKEQISPVYSSIIKQVGSLNKEYYSAIISVFPDEVYYADANGTLRLTFGKVEGMRPANAVTYNYFTTIDGVMEKYIPGSYEYDLPEKLVELYEAKDFGKYAEDGTLKVCFIASNHTSGGNSGSPVLNGNGELIGLNFDRNWEGTMSDIMYDINQCRNISVDIRYVLFIIDKFANASHIMEELTLVESADDQNEELEED